MMVYIDLKLMQKELVRKHYKKNVESDVDITTLKWKEGKAFVTVAI